MNILEHQWIISNCNILFTVLNNNPNINNIKNDYVVWGKKKSDSEGKENAIHMRCAIDEKPEEEVPEYAMIHSSVDYCLAGDPTSDAWRDSVLVMVDGKVNEEPYAFVRSST